MNGEATTVSIKRRRDFLARFSVFFSGSRWRFTAPGDTTSRFELVAVQIHEPRKTDDPTTAVVVRFKGEVPAGYKARRRDRIYLDPATKRWFLITEDENEITFLVEDVGACFLTFRERLEKLGCVVAGYDINRILSRALYANSDLALAHSAMNKKGQELCDYARKMLAEHRDWFTPEERGLITRYLIFKHLQSRQ